MNEEIQLEENLFVKVDSRTNGLKTDYSFTFRDCKINQTGKISITVEHFESLNCDDLNELNIAADKCSATLKDWFENLKGVSNINDYANVAKLLPLAIIEFRDFQKRNQKK